MKQFIFSVSLIFAIFGGVQSSAQENSEYVAPKGSTKIKIVRLTETSAGFFASGENGKTRISIEFASYEDMGYWIYQVYPEAGLDGGAITTVEISAETKESLRQALSRASSSCPITVKLDGNYHIEKVDPNCN